LIADKYQNNTDVVVGWVVSWLHSLLTILELKPFNLVSIINTVIFTIPLMFNSLKCSSKLLVQLIDTELYFTKLILFELKDNQ